MAAARASGNFVRIADIQDQINAAAILSDRFGEAVPWRSGHPYRPLWAVHVFLKQLGSSKLDTL